MLTCHSVKGQSKDSFSNSSMEKSCQPDDFVMMMLLLLMTMMMTMMMMNYDDKN